MKRSPACTPQPEVQPLFFDLDLVKEEIPENEIKKEDISQFETFEHIFIKNEFNNETTLNTSKINQVQEQESVQVRQEWNSLLYNVYEEIEITVDDIKPEIIESRMESNDETTLNTDKIDRVQEQESVKVRQECNSPLYNVYEEMEITIDEVKPEIIEFGFDLNGRANVALEGDEYWAQQLEVKMSDNECDDKQNFHFEVDSDDTDADETWEPDISEAVERPSLLEKAFLADAMSLSNLTSVSKPAITSPEIHREIDQNEMTRENVTLGKSAYLPTQQSPLHTSKKSSVQLSLDRFRKPATEEQMSEVPPSEETNENNDNQKKNKYGKQFSCFYCGLLVSKLPRHLERKHSQEMAVCEFLAYPKNSNERLILIGRIRNKGNFLHNNEVITTGKGIFIPKKKPSKNETNTINEFLPCKLCRGFYKKKQLAIHIRLCEKKNCESNNVAIVENKRRLQSAAALLLPRPIHIEKIFESKVFGIMKNDQVFREITRDPLIVEFGVQLFNKVSAPDERHIRTFISQKMRELGRFVLEMKNQDHTVSNLLSCMTENKIRTVVNSINVVAGIDTENVTYKTPSVALKLGSSIKQCTEIAIGNALRSDNEHQEKVLEKFLKLFDEDIKVVSFKALRSLRRKSGTNLKLCY